MKSPWLLGLLLLAVLAQGGAVPARASGEAVPLGAIDVPPGAVVTVTFDVDVDDPLGVCASAVANQGTFTGSNVSPSVLTDDPDVGGAADPTMTVLDVVDLAITKTNGTATSVPGGMTTYTIMVSNAGPSPAVGATVTDTLPAALTGATWSCVASPGSSCTGAGAGNIGDVVTILAGGTLTYTLQANVAPGATGTLANTASVTAPPTTLECVLGNNSATDTDTLTPMVDLAITKDDGVTSVNAGSPTTYTIMVTNSGPSDAVGATVADTFPATLLGVTWTCSATPGSSCTAAGAGNIADLVTVRAGGSVTYLATGTVSGTATGMLSNTATVTAPGGSTDTNGANNSATDTNTIVPQADLSITKDDGVTTAVPGLSVTYTIVAANAGPATATDAAVTDNFPGVLTCSWTCVGAGGGSCTAGPVAGDITDAADLPAGATATYTAVCQIADGATGSLINTATIGGGGVVDSNAANNSATDTDTLLPLDYGDAPDSALGPPWAYPTLLADDGARHGVNGGGALRLGSVIDTEADGQPTLGADGDDLNPDGDPDDEDGVSLPVALVTCEDAAVTVTASGAAFLNAWVDFDGDGGFADAGEQVFTDEPVVAGPNALTFMVPCGATPTTLTFARFRLSSTGGLAWDGVAADGEVEDYTAAIRGLDFGDAPDPLYPTLAASNGARHVVTGSGPILGALIDAEADGQPNAGATGDDLAGMDDEDGVSFTSPLVPGLNATVTVTASAPGILNAWIDFDGDGGWGQPGDAIFTNQALAAGPNALMFAVPASADSNLATFARFRVATAGGLGPVGLAADGEVEDHAVTTAPVADLVLTKTDGSATAVPGNPVTYTITVTNPGPDPISGASVSDTFPAILTGVSWTCAPAGGASCTAGPVNGNILDSVNLPVGGSVVYMATGTVMASATGTLVNTATVTVPPSAFDPDTTNNSQTDTDTLTPEADLAITKTDGLTTAVPGTPITYTLTVANSGPSDAVAATVADTFPASLTGVSWTCVAAGGASCTAGPVNGNVLDTVNVPVGGSLTYTVNATIDPGATGTLSNTATVAPAAGTTDPMPGNNSATDNDTVLTPMADLAITKTDGVATEVPGTSVTYTITVTNAGPSHAVGANVSDTFPGIVSGVTWTCVATPGSSCTAGPQPGNVNDTVTVLVGGMVTYTATGTIASSATGTLVNTATVAPPMGTSDPNGANNSATDTDTLTPMADLRLTKEDSADPPGPGENLIYTLTVENLGPSDATGVVVTDNLPAEVTLVATTGCAEDPNGTPTCTLGSLAAGASDSYTIEVSINPMPPSSISNTASVTAAEPDPVSGNNTDTEITTLDNVPPQVLDIDTIAATGGGLTDCETARVAIGTFFVTFDEAMADPPGDTDPEDVTNPANYLLVGTGGDLDFDTVSCQGGAHPDDAVVAVAGVLYDAGTLTARLSLGAAAPLVDSQYRLLVCTSLEDAAGNSLDGDGNGTGGDDFVRRFRVDQRNLLANGHFDCDLNGWNLVQSTPGEITWSSADGQGAPSSGSAAVTNLAPGTNTSFALTQCVPVGGGEHLQAASRTRLAAADGVTVNMVERCRFYTGAACTGSFQEFTSLLNLADTDGVWLDLLMPMTAPASAVSVRCRFGFETPTGESFTGGFDSLILRRNEPILVDGFETGDVSAWTTCEGGECGP